MTTKPGRSEWQTNTVISLALELEGREVPSIVTLATVRQVSLQVRSFDLVLVDQVLEVQVVERVDPPRVDQLVAESVFIVSVYLRQAPVNKLRVDLH